MLLLWLMKVMDGVEVDFRMTQHSEGFQLRSDITTVCGLASRMFVTSLALV